MLELIIAAALFGETQEAKQLSPEAPAAAPASETQSASHGQARAWTLPNLNYSGNGCEQFMQRSLDGFGNVKVGTPCPTKPAVAASKGRSMDKRN